MLKMDDLDQLDRKILQALQKNARITHKQLAAQLDLSITPVFERVKKLERRGFIKHYAAILDPAKVEHGLTVFLQIKLQVHDYKSIALLVDEVNRLDEIMECYHITGESDYLLKVLVKDMKAYEEFVVDKLTKIPGIANMTSCIVMSTTKHKTEISF
jgi:Lrp/AsnC family leucine-responsive transcriptional regulator